jgi:RecB family exonuclease
MARGFESKQVEAQQEEAARPRTAGKALTPDETDRLQRRRLLELSRARLVGDLERATRPAHHQMLTEALAALEAQIRDLAQP